MSLEDQRAGTGDRVGDVPEHLLGVGGVPVVDELAGTQQRRGHRAGPGGLAAVGGERRPRGLLLVLGQADRPAAGQALGGLLQHVRADAEGVADDEADGAGDGGVRPEAGAERAARGIEAEFVPDRAVDHDHGGGAAGGLPAAAAGGALAHQRVERGQHHRYVAFLSIAIWALAGPDEDRARRLARAASISGRAMLLLAWFVIPMMLVSSDINRSRWEANYKFDSYGAPLILRELFSGRLLDFGRLPVLSAMVALGTFIAALNFKDSLARCLLY